MIGLDTIRTDMEAQLEIDRSLHTVIVNADTVTEALSDAATQLDTKISNLEYEVLERGSDGFMGLAKKPWRLRIYQNEESLAKKRADVASKEVKVGQVIEEEKVADINGMYYIRHFTDGIYLKVVLPTGFGKPAEAREIINDARRPDTTNLDENKIKTLAKDGTDGEYVAIGKYNNVKSADASMVLDVSKDEMSATITVNPPDMSGAEISAPQIVQLLETQGIVAGMDDQKIAEFVDNPVYGVPYEVAHAVLPQDGRDAYISFNFETDTSKLKMKESETGQVNFKELNQIQNVVEGQPLAKKNPPERGKAGKTVFGRYLEAKNGKDIKIPLGKNVRMDEDGLTVVAAVAGRVVYADSRISVEPVLELESIGIKTGNIDFLGSVVVKGNVEDGYELRATGNIEIFGTVGKSVIKSEHGDIVVSQGIFGQDEGVVQSGKSLWAKFIQNAKIEVEEYCVVSDSLMNSEVTAMKCIYLTGKKAQIIGGHLFATEEICAKNIGSPSGGAETILEVGYDPRSKRRLEEIINKQTALTKELEDVENNLTTLENIKKQRRMLPPDKEKNLEELTERKMQIINESDAITEEIEKLQSHLHELRSVGRVRVAANVYSGVRIYIRDTLQEIRTDMKALNFFLDGGFVRTEKYSAPDMSEVKAPEGYST